MARRQARAIVEIGPGRGTMMADMLRVIERLATPNFTRIRRVHLVETSERLRRYPGSRRLTHMRARSAGMPSFEERCRRASLLLAANELFDAIPIRQFVRDAAQAFVSAWSASMPMDELTFAAGIAGIDPALLPEHPRRPSPEGTIFEISPARDAVMAAALRASEGRRRHGAGIIDYGHLGDRLRRHAAGRARCTSTIRRLPIPADADLTSHVDFEATGDDRCRERRACRSTARCPPGRFPDRPRPSGARRGSRPRRRTRRTQESIQPATSNGLPAPARARWASFSRCWPSAVRDASPSAAAASGQEGAVRALTDGRAWP